ncbi:hypothetical protein FGG08_005335 [Glutinoglossum americanum]|uniref:NACHT-NTPase and P-loop NTPases N-terminal domain-containing protein n=1 Tax=Glutinoglossum americanum TaxID=1670608 RepID=A0A9P8I5P8_9PEZI|nr:hypothetical protein FGG08_005335 [Glutinoglossum americanum]
MAETIAIVGLVSSIFQIVDFGSRVVSRLNEFQSSANEVPKTFRDIKIQLPLVIDTLKQTQRQADAGHVNGETAEALRPVVDECLSQIRLLEDILAKAVPAEEDPDWKRRLKAFSSFAHDGAIQQITVRLERYVQTLTYYQASQQSKPILKMPQRKTCFMVKFDQDPNFIGREDIIKEISERFKKGQHRVAITGIGGVGKSQIAIEYCYRYRASHPEAQVFWVHASNFARFEEGYKNIAKELALPGFDDPDVDTLQLVLRWLSNDVNSPWLLVLDNADNMEVLFGSSPHIPSQQNWRGPATALAGYLPRGSDGLIVITTRDRRVGERLANRQKSIPVWPFTTADAEHLLQCKVPMNDGREKVESTELLEALGHLPLAITQAAAFISENDITIAEYLEILQAGNLDTEDLLGGDLFDPGRDLEIRNSVFQTWKLSFDQIRKQKPRAAEILSLMAVLDRQAISDLLLRNDNERKIKFITAIGTLKAFSLITEEKEGAIFGMHRLVQFSTQMWLKLQHELVKWQKKALEVVSKHCPLNGNHGNWVAWRAINPHVHAVLGYAFQTESCLLQRAVILNSEGLYNKEQEQHKATYNKLTEALAIREKVLGPDHMSTLDTVFNLGGLYFDQDKLTESETVYKRALAGREKTLGSGHTSTLETVNGLGELYWHQDKLTEAEAMYKWALAGRERALGPDHASTLATVNNLGNLYKRQGKLAEAEAMYKRALVGKEKTLGPDHRLTLATVNNLGCLYMDRDKLAEAEAMYKQALEGKEKTLGPDHTSTLATVNNLGSLYERQDKPIEAEAMYKRALAGEEKALGPDHRSTLATVNNLGCLYMDQDKLAEAEAMYKQALAGREKTLGLDHTSALATVHNLGNLYKRQGKLSEAEAMYKLLEMANSGASPELAIRYMCLRRSASFQYKQALGGEERTLGPDHRSTLATVNNLGCLYMDQDKLAETEAMYKQALAGKEKTLGPDHASVLATVNNLGNLFKHQGKLAEAEAMYKQALGGEERTLGPDHRSTLATVNNLGCLYMDQDKLAEAEAMYKQALVGREKTLGPDHTLTLATVNNLGNLFKRQGKLVEVEAMYKRALVGKEKTLGPDHRSTLVTVDNLGCLYMDQDKLAEAEAMYKQALVGREKALGPDHTSALATAP